MSATSRSLFVQKLDEGALEFARSQGFPTIVESRCESIHSALDGVDVIGAGASGHVLNDAIWQAAPGISTRLASALHTDPAVNTCIRQLWLAEVIAPLLAGYSEGVEVREAVSPTNGDAALVESGIEGDAFAAALGLPRHNPGRSRPKRRRRVTLGPKPGPVDVLLVELFSYRLVNLSEIAKALQRRGLRVGLLSLARSPIEESAHLAWGQANGVQVHSWRRWAAFAAASVAVTTASVSQALFKIGRSALPDELRAFFGHDLNQKAYQVAGRALAERAIKAIATYGLFRQALRQLKPRAVFTCRGDGPTLRALSLAGHAWGVPVVDVQHGRQNLLPPAGVAEIKRAHFAFASDHAGVVYREQGVPSGNIHLVGSVGFDAVMRSAREAAPYPFPYSVFSSCAATSTNVDQWNEATRVAAGAEPPAAQHAYALRSLDRFLEENPGDRIVVVLHPREDGARTRELVSALANSDRFIVLDRANNGPLFGHARFHLSLGSTTSLEAALVGTPAVVIEPSGHASYFDRAIELGAMQRVSQLSRLDAALTLASTTRFEVSAVVDSYAVSNDLKTVERLFNIPPLRGLL